MRVLILLYDGVAATDIVGPADALATANELAGVPWFELRYVARTHEVTASNGLVMRAAPLASARPRSQQMILVPGADERPLRQALATPQLISWIRAHAAVSARVCSVCSGAVLLAEAGVLDGRAAATHWRGIDALRLGWPRVQVRPDALYVEDGRVWTSAGVTAGIDMALAIVERDLGRPVAMQVAREMVLCLVRPGGQGQFSAPLDLQVRAAGSPLHALPLWLEMNLEQHITTADMARAVGMSERSFNRSCRTVFGMTPLTVVQTLRVQRARALLEAGTVPLKAVAPACGFGDQTSLGRVFREFVGTSPAQYRARFSRPAPETALAATPQTRRPARSSSSPGRRTVAASRQR
ncbi:MAG: helix-turn-helix domain-containing protein [Gemmatimonadaceae bacterium]|nr:helix-turn-helix domain-containing protein [Gemmatimonadaceae bacterium]